VHYTSPVDVLLVLIRDDRVLLALRQGTGYADGQWNLPSGKLDHGEDLETALLRETREEIGLHLQRDDVRMVTTVHHRNPEGAARIGFFFHAPPGAASPTTPNHTNASASTGSPWTGSPPTPCPTAAPASTSSAAANRSDLKAGHPTPATRPSPPTGSESPFPIALTTTACTLCR
jgi:8-oxo-dGTP diphosphatase